MRIPNVTIIIRSDKRHCSSEIRPAYFAEMYRRVWAGRLDSEKGIEIIPIDPAVGQRTRYTEVADVAQAERSLISYFMRGSSDPTRLATLSKAFNEAFPDGLRPVIEKLLREDLAAARERAAQRKAAPTAHGSFLEAGLTDVQAIALQARGFANVREVMTDDIIAMSECGLGAEDIDKVIAAQKPVEPIQAVNPLAAGAAAKG